MYVAVVETLRASTMRLWTGLRPAIVSTACLGPVGQAAGFSGGHQVVIAMRARYVMMYPCGPHAFVAYHGNRASHVAIDQD